MISGAGMHPRGKHRRAYIVQLVGMHRHREAGLLRRTEEWTNVVHIEHTFLHERIDRLCEAPIDDRRDRICRVADEPFAIVGIRRRQCVRGEVRDGDINRVFHTLERLKRGTVTGRDDRAIACRDEPIHHRADVARSRPNARTLVLQWRQREEARAVKDEVRRGHSMKWLSMTRSRVKASSLSESAATCRTASSGIRPMSSPRRTVTPAALARVSTSRHTVARDVTVWSSRFIETWTRGGSVRVKPFACTAGRPPDDSRIPLAIRCASFRSVESSWMLNAMRNGRAPTTMAPAVGCIRFGPASGTCVVSRSAARPSYSGLRMSGRRTRSGLVAAFA